MARRSRPRGVGAFLIICAGMLLLTVIVIITLVTQLPTEKPSGKQARRRTTKVAKREAPSKRTTQKTAAKKQPTKPPQTKQQQVARKPATQQKPAAPSKKPTAAKKPAPQPKKATTAKKPTSQPKKAAAAKKTPSKPQPKQTRVARATAPKPAQPAKKPQVKNWVSDADFSIRVLRVRFETKLPSIPGMKQDYEAEEGKRYIVVTAQIKPLRESFTGEGEEGTSTGAPVGRSKPVAVFKSTDVVLKDSKGNVFPCVGSSIMVGKAYLLQGDFKTPFTSKELRAISKELVWLVPASVKSVQLVYRNRHTLDLRPLIR